MSIEQIILSNAKISEIVRSKVAAEHPRKIAPALYTSNIKRKIAPIFAAHHFANGG
jgi:hypothetical protein